MKSLSNRRLGAAIGRTLFAACLTAIPVAARGAILSNNLSSPSGGVETATGDGWLTASFGTGNATYELNTATLLLASSGGVAQLDLYTDGGLQPGTQIALLTSPAGFSSTATEAVFTGDDITLTPNTTYWLVLQATSGSFDWSWTTENTGEGVGFQHTWGSSSDAGLTWFTFDIFPTQFSVDATIVPEPAAATVGVIALAGWTLRRRRSA